MKRKSNPTPDRLGHYLAATVSAGTLAGTSQAAIVNLDVSGISGLNANLGSDEVRNIPLYYLGAGLTGGLYLLNRLSIRYYGYTGLLGSGGSTIAIRAVDGYPAGYASPKDFGAGESIDSDSLFSWGTRYTLFTNPASGAVSPDFGADSFIGFRSANGHYGWLEVTWDSTAGNFEILSGAFENVAGVGIQAGAVAAVPEPASVLGTIGLLASGAFVRRRRLAA